MKKNKTEHTPESCKASINAIMDALYVLNGKWKIPLIVALKKGASRFKELERSVEGITPRVLSNELRQMELNAFVTRKVQNTIPVSVTYELTPHAASLDDIILALEQWGIKHRQYIFDLRKAECKEARKETARNVE